MQHHFGEPDEDKKEVIVHTTINMPAFKKVARIGHDVTIAISQSVEKAIDDGKSEAVAQATIGMMIGNLLIACYDHPEWFQAFVQEFEAAGFADGSRVFAADMLQDCWPIERMELEEETTWPDSLEEHERQFNAERGLN